MPDPYEVPAASAGNRLSFVDDGDAFFESLWEAIDAARERVWLEVYIYEPDAVGLRTLDALIRAARRGVDVILLYDPYASRDLEAAYVAPLAAAGGRVAAYNPLAPWSRLGRRIAPYLHRDHRKIAFVDGVAWTGGMNVTAEYAGVRHGTRRFYDTMVRIDGPAAADLARLLLGTLHRARGDRREVPPRPAPHADGTYVHVLPLNARTPSSWLNSTLLAAIDAARTRILLTSAYFVPDPWLVEALRRAAARGVDVRVMTAGDTDLPHARLAARHLYGPLVRGGVRVYEFFGRTLHAKNLVVDDLALIGSYNLDRWASRHNLEVGVAAEAPALARALAAAFDRNLDEAEPQGAADLAARSVYRRLKQAAAYRIAAW